ncbi:replication initiation protein [Gordonia phage Jambalaya]|uniref:Helix-turn-helix DNA binding domain protein n=1 Tax=Gordonia phage Jambalaya TaxID=2743985 RepID=A0A7D5FR97_9CAUD|nr:replication initiation protein [Gordonia phage Jambalaya]QLF84107.1 helix-turn-helix DNA binding domain protein [Gordonia phage Jambalaya]WKW87187.1 helix-turn-helix DNA binding domain protein [Gordonia phage Savbucketdawg]
MTTGRQYAKVWFRLMRDRDFTTMPQFDKMLYLAILASDSLNAAGVTPLYYRRWALACADDGTIPTDRDVKAGLTRLEANAYVYTDEYTGELLVRTFIRGDQVDKQPNVLKSALRAITAIQSDKLSAVLLGEFDRGITIPQIKAKTAESTRRMQDQMDAMATEAIEHLKATAEGITEPYPQPFPEEFPEGLSEPFAKPLTEGFQRPGKTEPFPKPFPEGMPKPPVEVVVGVEVETSPTEVVALGEQPEIADTDTADTTSDDSPNGPPPTLDPEWADRCSDCGDPVWTGGADGKPHPSGRCPNCRADTSARNDPEPPSVCANHRRNPNPGVPCRACGNLRRAHERWTERENRRRTQSGVDARRTQAELTRAEIDACDLCDDRGYELTTGDGPSGVCRHNPDQAATNARGRAKLEQLRAQMAAGKSTPKPDPEPDPEPEP